MWLGRTLPYGGKYAFRRRDSAGAKAFPVKATESGVFDAYRKASTIDSGSLTTLSRCIEPLLPCQVM